MITTRFRRALAATTVALLAGAGALLAAAPAYAAPATAVWTIMGEGEGELFFSRYVSVAPETGAATPIGTGVSDTFINAIEIDGTMGYAVASTGPGSDPVMYIWSTETGEVTSGPLALDATGLDSVIPDGWSIVDYSTGDLDLTPDGRLLMLVFVNIEDGSDGEDEIELIVEVDRDTFALTPLVNLTAEHEELSIECDCYIYKDAIATDPITGQTYLFIDDDSGWIAVQLVDLGAGTLAAPVQVGASAAAPFGGEGNNWIVGADFDEDGTLFFFQSSFDTVAALPGPSTSAGWLEGTSTQVGLTGLDLDRWNGSALAVQSVTAEPAPELAETGLEGVGTWMGVAALLLVLGTATVLARTRRIELDRSR